MKRGAQGHTSARTLGCGTWSKISISPCPRASSPPPVTWWSLRSALVPPLPRLRNGDLQKREQFLLCTSSQSDEWHPISQMRNLRRGEVIDLGTPGGRACSLIPLLSAVPVTAHFDGSSDLVVRRACCRCWPPCSLSFLSRSRALGSFTTLAQMEKPGPLLGRKGGLSATSAAVSPCGAPVPLVPSSYPLCAHPGHAHFGNPDLRSS